MIVPFGRQVFRAWHTVSEQKGAEPDRLLRELLNALQYRAKQLTGRDFDLNQLFSTTELTSNQRKHRIMTTFGDEMKMYKHEYLMDVSEAVKILQLKVGTLAEIEQNYIKLMSFNHFSGGSKYLFDKIEEARYVATESNKQNTLSKHIPRK